MGQAFSACNCLSGPQKEMVLATDRGEHRETSLKLQETLNRTKKCHKVDTSFTHMKILSKLFSSQKDLNAEKIQKVYRGHNYRKNVFPKEKQKLLKEEEKYLKDLNKKYITTDLKSYEKLFDLKLSNPQIKTFLKEIDSDVFKYSKAKTSDKTNSNYQKNKIIVRPYNGIPSFYQGQINEFNEPHGEGILYNEFGCKYDGTFFNGEFTGYGKYIDSLGNCYEGNFCNGLLNGKGIKIISTEDYYMGEFKDGLYDGYGKEETIEYSYEGNFDNDKKNGKGKIIFKNNKDSYEGEFKDDNITGYGTYIWANKHIYTGYFLDGKMSGKGIYKWKDGSSYEGEYKDGIKEGKGKFIFRDGKIFIGTFKNGSPDGKGVYIIKGVDIEVEYKNGKIVGNLKDYFLKKINETGSIISVDSNF